MRKYAAAIALAIALITMLALTVSASVTSANAGSVWCGPSYFHSGGSWPICLCQGRCGFDAKHDYAIAPAGARPAIEKKQRACEATCVNAKQATQH
jgi:hypothetical protein